VPSRAAALGAALRVRQGQWRDSPADSAFVAPTVQQLYDELDRFHIPPVPDSTWAEWDYFNVSVSAEEWWYLTYLVGGALPAGRWGGRLLLTHRRPDGRYDRFTADVPAREVVLDTAAADLALGPAAVRQRDGVYHLTGTARGPAGLARLRLEIRPVRHRYFPPVELRDEDFVSGYVVPGLSARAAGSICVAGDCRRITDVPAYHDHNWGVWREVTWEWGAASGSALSLLYGGVYGPERQTGGTTSPFFLTVVDSLGVRQVLRFDTIAYTGRRPADGAPGAMAPARFTLAASRGADTVRLTVEVEHALATDMSAATFRRLFFQMRGRFVVTGRLAGATVSDSGRGFFETYRTR
jgi:hypothetical protein